MFMYIRLIVKILGILLFGVFSLAGALHVLKIFLAMCGANLDNFSAHIGEVTGGVLVEILLIYIYLRFWTMKVDTREQKNTPQITPQTQPSGVYQPEASKQDIEISIPKKQYNFLLPVAILLVAILLTVGVVSFFENNSVEALLSKGERLAKNGKYTEAINCYDRALELDPNNLVVLCNKGMVLTSMGGTYIYSAITCYDKALEINPDYPSAWYDKGLNLEEQGKYTDACKCYEKTIVCYDKAFKEKPDDINIWNEKGLVYRKLKKFDNAITCYDRALKIDPEFAMAWNNKGNIYRRTGKIDNAIKCYDKALGIEPDLITALSGKEWCNTRAAGVKSMLDAAIKSGKTDEERFGNTILGLTMLTADVTIDFGKKFEEIESRGSLTEFRNALEGYKISMDAMKEIAEDTKVPNQIFYKDTIYKNTMRFYSKLLVSINKLIEAFAECPTAARVEEAKTLLDESFEFGESEVTNQLKAVGYIPSKDFLVSLRNSINNKELVSTKNQQQFQFDPAQQLQQQYKDLTR